MYLYVLCNMSDALHGSVYGKKHKGTWDITGITLELHWNYTGTALELQRMCTEAIPSRHTSGFYLIHPHMYGF